MLTGVPAVRMVQNGTQHVPLEQKKIGKFFGHPQIVPTEQVLAIPAFAGIIYFKFPLIKPHKI